MDDEMTGGEYEAARARGDALLRGPRAASVHYDSGRDRVIVRLTTGIEIGFEPSGAEGLEHATAADLEGVEVDALGLAIRFPSIDADFYVPALLDGILGSRSWMELHHPTRKAG
jgi:hypothetical protein